MTTPPGAGSPPPPPPPPPPGYGRGPSEPPHPSGTTSEERTWALVSHIGCLVGTAFAGLAFVVPLVIMLTKGTESAFVREHAVESLNFQLSMLIYVLVSFVLVFVLVGFLLLAALGIAWLVLVVVATMRASEGRAYRYPLTIRFVH